MFGKQHTVCNDVKKTLPEARVKKNYLMNSIERCMITTIQYRILARFKKAAISYLQYRSD